MATVKQLNMLCAKARAAGMEFDREAAKDLDNGEIDAKIAEIEKFARDGQTVGSKVPAERPKELNGMRFGMAYKIVREKWNSFELKSMEGQFLHEVVDEYNRSMKAEEAVMASSSSEYYSGATSEIGAEEVK